MTTEQKWRGEAKRTIERNARSFEQMLVRVEHEEGRGDVVKALAWAQVAASFAWHHHPGFYSSLPLERLIASIGASGLSASRPSQRTPTPRSLGASDEVDRPHRVAHVLTQADSTGGHSRLVWRWVRDSPDPSTVLLTRQRSHPIPTSLKCAVASSNSRLVALDAEHTSPLDIAARLSEQLEHHDVTILHTDPDDIVPILATPFLPETAIAVMNHADHTFWLNVSLADTVINFRNSGENLCLQRRGFSHHACLQLPLPLDHVDRAHTRPQAKSQLNLPEECFLIVSMASAYKYVPWKHLRVPHFTQALEASLAAHENLQVRVIGPRAVGPWRKAERMSGGRLKAIGPHEEPTTWLEAADLFLDSFPFNSLTARLEAGQYATPVLTFSSTPAGALPFGGATLNERSLLTARDLGELRDIITRYVEGGTFDSPVLAPVGADTSDFTHVVESTRKRLGERSRHTTDTTFLPKREHPTDSDLVRAIQSSFRSSLTDVARHWLAGVPSALRLCVTLRLVLLAPHALKLFRLDSLRGARRLVARVLLRRASRIWTR